MEPNNNHILWGKKKETGLPRATDCPATLETQEVFVYIGEVVDIFCKVASLTLSNKSKK